jgi:hypothetical protein
VQIRERLTDRGVVTAVEGGLHLVVEALQGRRLDLRDVELAFAHDADDHA